MNSHLAAAHANLSAIKAKQEAEAAKKKAEAQKTLRDLERKSKQRSASPYAMATIYAGLGENDKAFEFLEKAYKAKSFEILSLKSDLVLDSLHSDPRFQNLVGRIGLN